MIRLLAILSMVCVVGASVALGLPGPWAKAEQRAAEDAERLSALLVSPDKVSWRLMEDIPLVRTMLWDAEGARRYPPPDGMAPLPYEFSDDAERWLNAFMAEVDTAAWAPFDVSGNELVYCRAMPAACVIYERVALEEALELRPGSLASAGSARGAALLLGAAGLLLACASLWLRRRASSPPVGFSLIRDRHMAIRDMLEVSLTPRDLKLLTLLEERGGAVVTKDELYDAGWGRDYMPNSRALDQHIVNLRRKLDPDKSRPVLIETVHGVGYRLVT
ncbi:winged helix-turn-helix domain-containing protein [Dinoroseobacter sp. S124A]|uniref:winged helix-turn-helix domain-containing protein n=1 Tax=Dinoroseobacter sp. S124A TaxID=3415128 RepID=UPI003C7C1778